MRFEVPQFIDVEDKLFGPLTFKQFIYLGGGGGLCYALYKLIPWIYVSLPLMLVVAGLAAALSFYKLNNQPFIKVGQSFISYMAKNKLYVWKKEVEKQKTRPVVTEKPVPLPTPEPEISNRRIQDLARNLDILDKTRYN
jgi:hypothetical protein